MNFKFHIGTMVLFGRKCVMENKNQLLRYGNRVFIVTGKCSGKLSGALKDVVEVMEDLKIDYSIYDGIGNNPTLLNVKEGGIAARKFNADLIIGIGGGSPLDASKAIAVLAVNNIEPIDLYKNVFDNTPLPIIAVPTTAGTGSEVTPYSILTRDDMQTKMSFGNEDTFPKIAFLDPAYTESMPINVTVNTAVDALSHAVEGYLSKRSTPTSDIMAEKAIGIFGECIGNLRSGKFEYDIREKLLYVSMLAGMVISHTGTTIVHGMGYSLTYFKDIPHGKANGLVMAEYLRFNYEYSKAKIGRILVLLGIKDINDFAGILDELLESKIEVTQEELKLYASLTMKQRSTGSNIRSASEEDIFDILNKSLIPLPRSKSAGQ